jgi:hypothetical protein
MTVSEQQLGKHVPTETNTQSTIEKRCFRCGLFKVVIKNSTGATQLVDGWQLS